MLCRPLCRAEFRFHLFGAASRKGRKRSPRPHEAEHAIANQYVGMGPDKVCNEMFEPRLQCFEHSSAARMHVAVGVDVRARAGLVEAAGHSLSHAELL